jgi:hypothetical protein
MNRQLRSIVNFQIDRSCRETSLTRDLVNRGSTLDENSLPEIAVCGVFNPCSLSTIWKQIHATLHTIFAYKIMFLVSDMFFLPTARGSLLTNDRVAEFLTRSKRHGHVPTATLPNKLPNLPDNIDVTFVCCKGGDFYLLFRIYKEWEQLVMFEHIEIVHPATYFDCKYQLEL